MDLKGLKTKSPACRGCSLRPGTRQVVSGSGNPGAGLMLVGEGLGAREDRVGRPFAGAAGQLLGRLLKAAGFRREEVYITNIVKCRPPGNRMPEPAEVEACRPLLDAAIDFVRPQIIVCLGALATRTLVAPGASITRLRGRWIEKDGIRYLPTFHPAALLRDGGKIPLVEEDFRKLRAAYQSLHTKQLALTF
ncbi:uracil DNA glycosylase superfamily protein [Moorella thermoacetica]|uniref:Type-4 uracil-DNA glycosylase n=1 Tax=Neomoorella thermoacetica TaxID=1525 RepID=A0A1J5JHY4_NEOTH|nr:uracil-DNA glycosylase [Moorella thermoacetica]OIQ09130.1 uracil DNA glycosylase superfamily protein [Moorella thermoacetica]